jgi:hypothetical protein
MERLFCFLDHRIAKLVEVVAGLSRDGQSISDIDAFHGTNTQSEFGRRETCLMIGILLRL